MNCRLKFLIIFFAFLISPQSVFALNEKQFIIDYDISYKIQPNGETLVEQGVSLTNLKNDVVPTNYSFSIKEIKIYDVTAETNGKKVNVEIVDDENESGFSIPIENHSIGKDRQNKIKVTYKTTYIAVKGGNIWNVFIPKIQIPDTTEVYNIKIYVPKSFGNKMYFSPTPVAEKEEGDSIIYYLTKESFRGSGVSAAFGDSQIFNYKIRYQLENTFILPANIEITLPPDVENYQQVSYTDINPKPKKIKVDADGNSIAVFSVSPKEKLQIELTGSAKSVSPQINPDYGGDFISLPKDLVSKYTKEQKYWEIKTTKIVETKNKIKNENLNVIKNAQAVYEFVVNNLTYDFEAIKKPSVERHGSETALTQKGNWTCMEYADLFIALTRSIGIPAREVDGYAFNNNDNSKPLSLNLKTGDLLHAWAEFYDPKYGWIQVDPTWGSTSGIDYFTKLDTNHLILVKRGVNSEYPNPAGSFRYEEGTKLIDVDYSQKNDIDVFEPKVTLKKVINYNILELIKGKSKYLVENNGSVFVYNLAGKNIAPYQKTSVYLPKEIKTVNFETLNKVKHELSL